MRTQIKTTALSIFFAAAAAQGLAQAQTLDSSGVAAVPTYEAVGLYWNGPAGATASGGCEVKFRVAGASAWTQGLAMVYDSSKSQCRGSLVGLTQNTSYEAQLNLPGQAATKSITFTTWANAKPVAQTIKVASGSTTVNVNVSGTATGYVVYDGTGATLDGTNVANNITVNASYVIVRGFTLKNAQQNGILIDKNQHDVIIEDNDISNWGRTRDGTWATDMDSGVRAICQNEELTRVTVQRNKIHDPRYPANSWTVAHPAGAQGITFSYCGGNSVYRWNEITSSKNHYNDGMGGEDNFSTSGWPNKDSDVYGNKITKTWDDGIEAEGGNMNVRIWGNYIDQTGTGIASTIDSVGPMYIFRNIWDRNEFYEGKAHDSDDRQPMFKSGSSSDFNNGRRYLFHNTMLQRTESGSQYGLGGGAGVGGTGSTQLVHNTISMNNVYNLWKPNGAVYQVDTDNTFQSDMFNGSMGTAVVNGINAAPSYASGSGNANADGGMYQLASGSAGFDRGVRIPNFNDHFNGAAPDVGAAEAGDSAMVFGVAAASASSSVGGSGTTTTTTGGTGGTTTTTGGSGSTSLNNSLSNKKPLRTGGNGSGGSGGTGTTGTTSVSLTIDSSSYTITSGGSVTFTVAVMGNSSAPTGTVNFTANGTTISGCGAVSLSSGKATCTTSSLAKGSNAVKGLYSGDATYTSGVAGPITETVN